MSQRARGGLAVLALVVTSALAPVPPAPAGISAPDTTVSLTIHTTKVRVDQQSRSRIEVTCPAEEESGPCTGRIKVKTRDKLLISGQYRLVLLAVKRYTVGVGETARVRIELFEEVRRLVERRAAARKLRIQASVSDTAGNRRLVNRRAVLELPE